MFTWFREMLGATRVYQPSDPGAATIFGQNRGGKVPVDDAMSLSAVFSAINILGNSIASLPLNLHEVAADGVSTTVASRSPVQRMLHDEPNAAMTSSTFRHLMEYRRNVFGNAFAEITYPEGLMLPVLPASLTPIDPRLVDVMVTDGTQISYRVYPNGRDGVYRDVAQSDMLHLIANSVDGIVGRSFLECASGSLKQGLAAQQYATSFFDQGARPGGILSHPGTPSDDARKKLRDAWERRHAGADSAHRTAVLWGGWQYQPDGSIDPERSQLLAQRQFTVEEVARWLNMPPHMLRDLRFATYSNIEQQALDFVKYTMTPIVTHWEQELKRRICTDGQYVKFNLSALLRGDTAARSQFYREMFMIGVLSINEIRELEDRNPIDGGDRRFVPLNMVELGRDEASDAEPIDDSQGVRNGNGNGKPLPTV